jgi:outer membrane protein assembly factor BamB
MLASRTPLTALIPLLLVPTASADWSNLGGNAGRNGLVAAVGPVEPIVAWSGAPDSLIAWTPIVEGNRVFTIRQTYAQAPFNPPPGDSVVHCFDLETGASLWSFDCPYQPGDWTTVVYGAAQGRVFVGRGGNGSTSFAPVYCLNAETGQVIWTSTVEVGTGAYDGVVFADDGDPIFASGLVVRRLNSENGAVVWSRSRSCSVTGDCGPARAGDAVYIDEVGPGGQRLSRLSLATGVRLYQSEVMPGFLSQNTPFCGANGMVFYPRTQGSGVPTVDVFYAFKDTGTQFELKWTTPCIAGAGSQHAVTADGGVVLVDLEGHLEIRDQETGELRHESADPVVASINQSHIAVDASGAIYYGNGGFPGTIYRFNSDLTLAWSLVVPNLNQGGPVLAGDGSLLVAGVGTNLLCFRDDACEGDLTADGVVDAQDIAILLGAWGPCRDCDADLDGDGSVSAADLALLLGAWGACG